MQQKECHDMHARDHSLLVGEEIYYRNFGDGPKWKKGCIFKMCGLVAHLIRDQDERLIRRHVDHIRKNHRF